MDKFTSTMSEMSLFENLRLREGQAKTVELALSGETEVRCKLPTGYGKTLTAVCCYAGLRAQGRVNRMLYVVPRTSQAEQALEISNELYKAFNIDTLATLLTKRDKLIAIKRNKNDESEIFVVTYQSLTQSAGTIAAIREVMLLNNWMIVVDEYHHVGLEGAWCDAIKHLKNEFLLAMSATPKRLDKKTDYFDPPQIRVDYIDAFKEKAVKELHLHRYEYIVDVVFEGSGDVLSLTTSELKEECKTNNLDKLDAEMARRKMRWSPRYISPLIAHPADRMADYRLRGIRSQMIVQAMTCRHAKMVCQQIKSMLPTLSVDWVGTGDNGRKDVENSKVLNRFCPPKINGFREWDLDVLVQVGMAGEGLDTVDVTEIVVLAPANINPSTLQLIGRASRIMDVGDLEQPAAFINVDTDSELGKDKTWLGRQVMLIFDGGLVQIDPDEKPPKDFDYKEMPDMPILNIRDVRLKNIETDPIYLKVLEKVKEKTYRTDSEIKRLVREEFRCIEKERNDAFVKNSTLTQMREAIDHAVGKIAGLLFRRLSESGMRPDRSVIGNYKKRINTRKAKEHGSIDVCDFKELEKHYKWLKELETLILNNHGTLGLPQWLR